MLGHAHRPHEHRGARFAIGRREGPQLGGRASSGDREIVERDRGEDPAELRKPFGVIAHESLVDSALVDQDFEYATHECEVAAGVDLIEGDRYQSKIEVGRTLRGLAVAFNYLGPIVDSHSSGARHQ